MKLFFLLFFCVSISFATNYALVIGLDHQALQGAVNDAKAIGVLFEKHQINNTVYLYNEKATRKNILHALRMIVNNMKKSDSLYIFFSGHGTSMYDPGFAQNISQDKALGKLLENSGALIPWDFDSADIKHTIISAKRDLAPLFAQIDKKGAFALVMIDACFSGMSYKEFSFSGSLPIALEPNFGEETYPYQNIIYLASTSVSDWAVEDKSQKPYRGYFSRALERCLSTHESLQALKTCLEASDIPQSVVVYPQDKDFYLFDNSVPEHQQ